jgi:hypothetical protein
VTVVWNPRTPAPALARLAEGPVEMQAGVAQNPGTAPGVLGRLAEHPESLIRSATATNPRLPLPLIHVLAHDPDPDPEVRRTAEEGVRAWGA